MLFLHDTKRYMPISNDESDAEDEAKLENIQWRSSKHDRTLRFCLQLMAILALVSASLLVAALIVYLGRKLMPVSTRTCMTPRMRREWRALTSYERQNYIEAVQCLQRLPSELVGRGTFYDDLVYVHYWVGSQSHAAASFLPWHRASLHVYESLLIEKCGLNIPVPYWNWELDHQSLEMSSIWSPDTGFGGDGSFDVAEGLAHGRCVVDGPFANLTRLYWEEREEPHCLGRSFMHFENSHPGEISGGWFAPDKIGLLKRSIDYVEFEDRIENTVHNGLHWGVRGDFSSMTSANEPLFWLHHAQLDRLWWEWQAETPKVRLTQYEGISFNTTAGRKKQATLDDALGFMNLWRDIMVSEVMDTEGSLLCYRY